MSSGLNLSNVVIQLPPADTVQQLLRGANQMLLNLNQQMQQPRNAFTLTKPVLTKDGYVGGITAGNIIMGTTNYIRGGATGYNAGTGFFLGYDTSGTPAYKFFVGNSAGNKITWDGSSLAITGTITATTGSIGGFNIGLTTLSAGANSTYISLSSTGSVTVGAGVVSKGVLNYQGLSMYGTTGNLGVSLLNDATDSGQIKLYNNGSQTITLNGNTGNIVTVNGSMQAATMLPTTVCKAGDGSLAAPSYSFISDTDTGLRWNSSGDFRAVCNGADVLVVRTAAIVCLQPLKLNNNYVAGAPAATGYVTIQDSAGSTYKLLCAP